MKFFYITFTSLLSMLLLSLLTLVKALFALIAFINNLILDLINFCFAFIADTTLGIIRDDIKNYQNNEKEITND